MKFSRTVPVLAATMLVLAACGGADDDPTSSEDTGGDAGGTSGGDDGADDRTETPGELVEITVGALPIADTAPVWLGAAEGFFEEEGIDLTVEPTQGGAAATAGLMSGDYDFAFANTFSVITAVAQGLDVRYVANGASSSGTEDGFGAVVVAGDSDIQSAADLPGRDVGVHNFQNIVLITVSHAVEQAGGDPEQINYIEIALAEGAAAVDNGNIDAAMLVEPYLTTALLDGQRVVSWAFQSIPDLDIGGYMTTNAVIDSDPELVAAFTRAMNRSLEYAADNPDAVREIISTYTEIPADVLAELALPTFRTEFNREGLEELNTSAVTYGLLEEEVDLDLVLPRAE